MYNNRKNGNRVTRKIIKSMEAFAPTVIVSVRPVSSNKWQIKIFHPNTNADGSYKELYCKNHIAHSQKEALAKGNELKATKFANVKREYEEILHISRPRRGKMKLNLQDDLSAESQPLQDLELD